MRGTIFFVPEALAETPISGEVIVGHWWTVHPEKGVAFYTSRSKPLGPFIREEDEPAPQCNHAEHVARHIQERLYPNCITKKIPAVYLAHARKAMRSALEIPETTICPAG